MENDYWLERWRVGRIGWHQDKANRHLTLHGRKAFGAPGTSVLVPMCGKSRDLLWLEEQGYSVTGVELSEAAVSAFHEEHRRSPEVTPRGSFRAWSSGSITILEGDIFELTRGTLGEIQGIYDRAAYHALKTRGIREAYARRLLELLDPDGQILLLALDYDQSQMEGPPFAVSRQEVVEVFQERAVTLLADREVINQEPKLRQRGLSSCRDNVFLIGPAD